MDSRHISLEQETLNQIIETLEQYVNNKDIVDSGLNRHLSGIQNEIYAYLGIIVPMHNDMTSSVVPLWNLRDLQMLVEDKNHANGEFVQLIERIRMIVRVQETAKTDVVKSSQFQQTIKKILNNYSSLQQKMP